MIYLMSIVYDLFLLFLHLLIMQKCMTAFLGPGKQNWKVIISWMIYYVFLVLINNVLQEPPLVLIIGNIIMVYCCVTASDRGSVCERCIFSIFICAVWMIVEVSCAMILTVCGAQNATLSDAGNIISKLIMLIVSVFIGHYKKVKSSPELSLRYFLVIMLVPASSIYIMHNIFIIAALHKEYSKFSAITCLLLLLINYVVFGIYEWMSRDAMVREQNRLYEQQLELCSKQAEERESLYLEIRRMRHDMKNYLLGILGAVQNGEKVEAESIIYGMLEDGIVGKEAEISRSGNVVVDSLINHKYALAVRENISFEVNVFIPVSLPFQSGHIAIILGNLLENAVEACKKVQNENKYIKVEISYVKEMLQICIRNSCYAFYKKDNKGKYLTTKQNSINHGIGLSSVEQAVTCYHGEMIAEGDKNEFMVSIIMYGDNGKNYK